MRPLGFAKGGHFEVRRGIRFLQITWFFLNAVLLLYLKLFTCLEIITMLKWSFEMLNDVITSCSAQVIISQEVAKWLKKPAQGENFEILFFKLEYYHFKNVILIVWKTQFFPNAIYPTWFVPEKKPVAGEKNWNLTFRSLTNGNIWCF